MSSIQPSPPFSVSVVIAYRHKVYVSFKPYATLSLTHAALKWFHPFIPGIISNPLDAAICHKFLEAAKCSKPVVAKKEPISADIIKKIIDEYAGPSANLKDLRLACICSLAFAGLFRHYEFSSILLTIWNFRPIICMCLCIGPRTMFTEKGIRFILRGHLVNIVLLPF